MPDLWPHQRHALAEVPRAIAAGGRRILVASPTGAGKSRVMCELALAWLREGLKVSLYTNRRLLIDQTSRVLREAGLFHGVRAAGHASDRERPLQVSSVQTEAKRCAKSGPWELHEADRVLVDEAHLNAGPTMRDLAARHLQRPGCVLVGMTATPLDLGGMYDRLIVAGTTSRLRACGALLPCHHYGPDEPDLRHVRKVRLGADLSEKENVKAVMRHGVFGRVLEWYGRLNPDRRPAILFAPGVAESLWFAEQFQAAGVPAAHIDGGDVWDRGTLHRANRDSRKRVLDASKSGAVKVLCNRFVLREGIDAPWLYLGILATVFGSLQSYLQSVGRLLRACPGLDHVVIQDHGGNWWRHGSANADREWRLGDTAATLAGTREEGFRHPEDAPAGAKPPAQPFRCPRCAAILACAKCFCGWDARGTPKSRPVIQADGSPLEMRGDVFRPRRTTSRHDAAKVWERVYHRCRRSGRTFRQAEALFARENDGFYPPHTLPLMPRETIDWFRKIQDVPKERLK